MSRSLLDQRPFEKDPDFEPIANKSRAPARAMTEPILSCDLVDQLSLIDVREVYLR